MVSMIAPAEFVYLVMWINTTQSQKEEEGIHMLNMPRMPLVVNTKQLPTLWENSISFYLGLCIDTTQAHGVR